MVPGKPTISSNMPFMTTAICTCIAIFSKATKTIFTATSRTDAALAIGTRRFSTLLTAVFAASGASAIMIRIRAVGINQEQPIDQRTAASRTQNGNNKQAGRKMSHSFNIPSVVNYLAYTKQHTTCRSKQPKTLAVDRYRSKRFSRLRKPCGLSHFSPKPCFWRILSIKTLVHLLYQAITIELIAGS